MEKRHSQGLKRKPATDFDAIAGFTSIKSQPLPYSNVQYGTGRVKCMCVGCGCVLRPRQNNNAVRDGWQEQEGVPATTHSDEGSTVVALQQPPNRYPP